MGERRVTSVVSQEEYRLAAERRATIVVAQEEHALSPEHRLSTLLVQAEFSPPVLRATELVAMVEYGQVYPYRVSALAGMVEYGKRLGLRASALVGMAEHAAIEDDWLRTTLLAAMVEWDTVEQERRRRFGPPVQCL